MSYVRAAAAAAVVLFAVAGSSAQAQTLAPVYAGGFLQEAQPKDYLEEFRRPLAITLVPRGTAMRVRIAIGMACSNGARRRTSDDLLIDAALQPDGTYGSDTRLRSDELGDTRARLTATALSDRISGVVSVRGRRGKETCSSGDRPFTARPVDVNAPLPAGGAPAPGTLLVGLSTQRTTVPYPVVARISRDGTRVGQLFGTILQRCRAHGRLAKRKRYSQDAQWSLRGITLRGGHGTIRGLNRPTAAQRRRGISGHDSIRVSVDVSAAGMRGTRLSSNSYRQRDYSERCSAPRDTIRLVPIS